MSIKLIYVNKKVKNNKTTFTQNITYRSIIPNMLGVQKHLKAERALIENYNCIYTIK